MWWKRNKGKKKSCSHHKKFGEVPTGNMRPIYRFSLYKKDTNGYGVSECNACGERVFTCIGRHIMSAQDCKMVDQFIAYKIDKTEFEDFLKSNNMEWWKYD